MGAPASQKGLKGKNTRLKQLSEQFWVAEKTYKGGGALKRPPLCRFFSLPKFFEHLLKSRIFSFQSLLACRGSQKLHFGDLGLTQKCNSPTLRGVIRPNMGGRFPFPPSPLPPLDPPTFRLKILTHLFDILHFLTHLLRICTPTGRTCRVGGVHVPARNPDLQLILGGERLVKMALVAKGGLR